MHWAKLFSVPETHPCGTPIDTLKLRQVIVDIACVRRSKLKVVKKRNKVSSHSFCSSLSLSLSSSCIMSSPQSQSPQFASLSDTFNFVCPNLDPTHSHHLLLCVLPDSHHHQRGQTTVFPNIFLHLSPKTLN